VVKTFHFVQSVNIFVPVKCLSVGSGGFVSDE